MRYFVRFRPVENFFFGGDVTFGDGANENYLVKSTTFPQQTTLLGTIRKEFLIQHGLLKFENKGYVLNMRKKREIETLIGPESFDISKDTQNFGVIEKMSPVFLYRENASAERDFVIPVPIDSGLVFRKIPGKSNFNNKSRNYIPFMDAEDPDPEKEKKKGFLNVSTGEKFGVDSIFRPVEKVGITKGRGSVTAEKAFYKQTSYKLLDGFEFACIMDLTSELKNSLVFMGADKSAFLMKVEKDFQKSFEDIFTTPKNGRVILLSDAYVEETIYHYCEFAATETISFRNIRTSTGNYRFKKEAKKHALLRRGSVLYVEKGRENEVKDIMQRKPNLQVIGYNISTL